MKEIILAFKNNEIFKDFNNNELWQLAGEMEKEVYVSGEKLFSAEEKASNIYILVDGHFLIHLPDKRAFTLMNPGDIIGTEPFLDKTHYVTTCTCLSKKGVCGVLTSKTLVNVEKRYASINSRLIRLKDEFLSKTKYFKR
ncbi:MAG: cyclic nucleotide-binding domain-containing protein [Desulforegulaceae bacterium]|nr:cyclic nucleotide-binding domain-containing protein [Desulforegulaceae bacterium]